MTVYGGGGYGGPTPAPRPAAPPPRPSPPPSNTDASMGYTPQQAALNTQAAINQAPQGAPPSHTDVTGGQNAPSAFATVAQALARQFIPQKPTGPLSAPAPGSKLSGLTNLSSIGQQWHALTNYMVQQGYLQLAHQSGTDPMLLLYQHSNSWDRQLINNLTYLVQHGEGPKFAPPVTFPDRYPSGGPTNPMRQAPVQLAGSSGSAFGDRAAPYSGYSRSAVAYDRSLPNQGIGVAGARDIYTGQLIPAGTPTQAASRGLVNRLGARLLP